MKLRILMVGIAALLAARSVAATPLTVTLASSLLTTTPGTNVTFIATLANPSAATEFLNGDSFTAALGVDDTAFFLNFPESLAPGASVTAPLFTVLVPSTTLPGLYSGLFDILGGATPSDLGVLATQTFAVNVLAAPAAIPEPATLSLVIVGTVASGFVVAIRKRRRTFRS